MKKFFFFAILALVSWTVTSNAQITVTASNTGAPLSAVPGTNTLLAIGFQVSNTSGYLNEVLPMQNITLNISGPATTTTFSNLRLFNSVGIQLGSTLSPNAVNMFPYNSVLAPGNTETLYIYVDVLQSACQSGCYEFTLTGVQSSYIYSPATGAPVTTTGLPAHGSGICVQQPYSQITIDSVPNTICQNSPFVPSWHGTWNGSTPSCGQPLVASWNFGSGANIQTWGNTSVPAVQYYQAGQHFIYLTLTDPVTGFSQQIVDTVHVYPQLNPNIWSVGNNQLNCLNDTVTLATNISASFGLTWTWNNVVVSTDSFLHATEPGMYMLFISNQNTCSWPFTSNFTVLKDPLAIDILVNGSGGGDSAVICSGVTKNLSTYVNGASNSWTYAWSTGDQTPWLNITTAGTYKVTVTNSIGCSATDDIVISNAPVQQVVITSSDADNTACANEPITITAPATFTNYQWSNTFGSHTIGAWQSGDYSVTVTDMNGCTAASNTITVTILPTPQVYLLADQNHCALNAQPTTETWYDWYLNDSLAAVNIGPYYNPTNNGWYSVEVTNTYGCKMLSQPVFMNCMATGITEAENETAFTLFPNPATDAVHVAAATTFDQISVLDVTGKEVIKIKPTNNEEVINTSELVSGIYILTATAESKNFSKRFVKQ